MSRKITRAVARIAFGLQDKLYLGNLDARRDWGHARDFVRAQWQILQQDQPDDYVIATGKQHSVREFCEKAFARIGIILEWQGEGVAEEGRVAEVNPSEMLDRYKGLCETLSLLKGKTLVCVDPGYFRPSEVDALLGDAGKARRMLGWQPEISFDELVREMVIGDLEESAREAICKRNGFPIIGSLEADM